MCNFKHRAGLWAATPSPDTPAAPVKVREATPSGSAWGSFFGFYCATHGKFKIADTIFPEDYTRLVCTPFDRTGGWLR